MKYSKQTNGFYIEGFHPEIPADAVSISPEEHAVLVKGQEAGRLIGADAGGRPMLQSPPLATLEERIRTLLFKVDQHLNEAAKAKGYDSILTAALRAGYAGPYRDEGIYFATLMDTTYARCYELLAQFKAGEIPEPNAVELIAMLPPARPPA